MLHLQGHQQFPMDWFAEISTFLLIQHDERFILNKCYRALIQGATFSRKNFLFTGNILPTTFVLINNKMLALSNSKVYYKF